MTTTTEPPAQIAPPSRKGEAPFLLWPVSRREFYMSIGVSLLPPLAWGMILFGWRVVGMLIAAVFAATLVHMALKRWTDRGRQLVFSHTILSVMILVSLCQPLWPGWVVALAAALIPFAFWLLGGPGRERTHVAILALLAVQYIAVPWLQGSTEWRPGILAKDRILMGDIRNQKEGSIYNWPASPAIAGFDAVRIERPGRVALLTLDRLSDRFQTATLTNDGGKSLGAVPLREAQSMLDDAMGKKLPSVEMLMLGVAPGPIAIVSLLAIAWGGLYLAYRYILRPWSVGTFFLGYVLTMAAVAISPSVITRVGIAGVWAAWTTFPGEIATLLSYIIFNSDLIFAAVFILALPGTEPLTARGRRVFLITAGILAALLARTSAAAPWATMALCALMPLAPHFDHYFGKRSWMNRFRT